jgi:uncharacterized membrane protein YraQ (UPF0718 family)
MNAILHFPQNRPRLFLGLAAVLWLLTYQALAPLAANIVEHLPVAPDSRLAESIQFFLYDAPKVLLLLTGVVMVMGMINSYFTAERTRVLLAGRAQRASATSWPPRSASSRPFCSCSAVPLFIGFVKPACRSASPSRS